MPFSLGFQIYPWAERILRVRQNAATAYGLALAMVAIAVCVRWLVGEYVGAISVTNGLISASYSGLKANTAISTGPKHLLFSPITHAGSIEWHCKSLSGQIKQKWCPSSCSCTG